MTLNSIWVCLGNLYLLKGGKSAKPLYKRDKFLGVSRTLTRKTRSKQEVQHEDTQKVSQFP